MKMKTIRKSVQINASKEQVWKVLLHDEYTRQWYAAFSAGTYADTDWKEGSQALFIDESRSGMITRVKKHEPGHFLELSYEGEMKNGVEDYDGLVAQSMKGGKETYTTTEKEGSTELSITCDMEDSMYDGMSASWEKALAKLKELAESNVKI